MNRNAYPYHQNKYELYVPPHAPLCVIPQKVLEEQELIDDWDVGDCAAITCKETHGTFARLHDES